MIINLNDLFSKNPKVKYTCAKKAINISKTKPNLLYPKLSFFVKLLDSENQVIKWTAILVIGNLSKVDKTNKVIKLFPRLLGFLKAHKMITANNTILALTEIAKNKPKYRNKIIEELLKIEKYNYDTTECRNIALGKVILALQNFKEDIKGNKKIMNFLKRQTKNKRNATKVKAQKLLRGLGVKNE